jgi:hypothetical protein
MKIVERWTSQRVWDEKICSSGNEDEVAGYVFLLGGVFGGIVAGYLNC